MNVIKMSRRRTNMSISLEVEVLEEVDKLRGLASRSRMINELLKNELKAIAEGSND